MKKENVRYVWLFVKLLLLCYLITGIILSVLAYIMWKQNPSNELVSGGIIFAYVISTFVGGLIIGKKTGKRKFLWGFVFGLVYFAIVFIISLGLNGIVGEPFKNVMTVFALCAAGGMLGGMLG